VRRDARRIEVNRRASVFRLDALALRDSSTIAWLTTSRGPSESVNSSPSALRRTARTPRVVSGIE